MSDGALKVPIVRTLLHIAKDNLLLAMEGGNEQALGHALTTSVFSAAAVEAGLSGFVYAATLLRGTTADPGPAFFGAVEEAVVKSATRSSRKVPADPIGTTGEDYYRAVQESKLGARTLLGIVADHCGSLRGQRQLTKRVHRLLDDRNDLLHQCPSFLDAEAYYAFTRHEYKGGYVIAGPPHEPDSVLSGWQPCGLDFATPGARAFEQATKHLEVAHEFLSLLHFDWSTPDDQSP